MPFTGMEKQVVRGKRAGAQCGAVFSLGYLWSAKGRWGSERQTCEGLPRVIQSMLWVQNASLPYPLPLLVLSLPTMPSIHPLPVPLVLLFPCPEYPFLLCIIPPTLQFQLESQRHLGAGVQIHSQR